MKLSARPRSSLFPVWLLGGLVLALVAGQRERATDTASYVVAKNVMVPMRDGVRLATDIYFPAKDGVRLEGKFPALLERTPYNFDVNPNTGEALNANRRLSVATNTVYHDREHPSHMILPIIPKSGH